MEKASVSAYNNEIISGKTLIALIGVTFFTFLAVEAVKILAAVSIYRAIANRSKRIF